MATRIIFVLDNHRDLNPITIVQRLCELLPVSMFLFEGSSGQIYPEDDRGEAWRKITIPVLTKKNVTTVPIDTFFEDGQARVDFHNRLKTSAAPSTLFATCTSIMEERNQIMMKHISENYILCSDFMIVFVGALHVLPIVQGLLSTASLLAPDMYAILFELPEEYRQRLPGDYELTSTIIHNLSKIVCTKTITAEAYQADSAWELLKLDIMGPHDSLQDAHHSLMLELQTAIPGNPLLQTLTFNNPLSNKNYAQLLRRICTIKSSAVALTLVKILLTYIHKLRIDINAAVLPRKQTALHHAAQHENIEVYFELLKNGANEGIVDASRHTPKHYLSVSLQKRLQSLKTEALQKCAFCEKKGIKLLRCSRCKEVCYCNQACQKQHWHKVHKQVCRATLLAGPGSAASLHTD